MFIFLTFIYKIRAKAAVWQQKWKNYAFYFAYMQKLLYFCGRF